jgi:hypothetical protein
MPRARRQKRLTRRCMMIDPTPYPAHRPDAERDARPDGRRVEFARRIDCADAAGPAERRSGRASRGRGTRDGEARGAAQHRLEL